MRTVRTGGEGPKRSRMSTKIEEKGPKNSENVTPLYEIELKL